MARPLRFQYAGAIYHVMARGDGGKQIFETQEDHQVFLARLGEVCGSHGWRIHAWVMMGNHFHLLLETPRANLVSGMKWLLGTFSQGWNRARNRRGHVFQGRYKSVPVDGREADAWYFRTVADYIHLNPARAGLAGGKSGALADYRWSSLMAYAKGGAPEWLRMERVLQSFELAKDGRGRRAYVAWLEARAAGAGGGIGEEALAALRRGWFLGGETFRDRLLGMVDKAKGSKARARRSVVEVLRDYGERDAERLVATGAKVLGLPSGSGDLAELRKGDQRKALLAALVRRRTGVGVAWIAERLKMGHPGSVSRVTGLVRRDPKLTRRVAELEELLFSGD